MTPGTRPRPRRAQRCTCSAQRAAGVLRAPALSRALCCPCSLQRLVPQLGERGDADGSAGHPESHLLHLRAGDAAHTHPGALQSDGAGGDADRRPEEVRAAGEGGDGAATGSAVARGRGELSGDGNAARPGPPSSRLASRPTRRSRGGKPALGSRGGFGPSCHSTGHGAALRGTRGNIWRAGGRSRLNPRAAGSEAAPGRGPPRPPSPAATTPRAGLERARVSHQLCPGTVLP